MPTYRSGDSACTLSAADAAVCAGSGGGAVVAAELQPVSGPPEATSRRRLALVLPHTAPRKA